MTTIVSWQRHNERLKVELSSGKKIDCPLIFIGETKDSSSEQIDSKLHEYLEKIGVIDE